MKYVAMPGEYVAMLWADRTELKNLRTVIAKAIEEAHR